VRGIITKQPAHRYRYHISMDTSHAPIIPPYLFTQHGTVRRVGVELEFGGLSLDEAAHAIQAVYGGEIVTESSYIRTVEGARFGQFRVEIDTNYLKEKRYCRLLELLGVAKARFESLTFERSLMSIFSTIVPFEISTPPIPLPDLPTVDLLREALRLRGAKGTRTSPLYAFGLHLNPEVPTDDLGVIADYVKAFILLTPWLNKEVCMNLTRRLRPYAAPFSERYARVVLRPGYPSDRDSFIADYLEYNSSRNRALDLLPLLATFDWERVMPCADNPHSIRPRKAFHYRMPNCLVDESAWSIVKEWRTWLAVEQLAADPGRIRALAQRYFDAKARSLRPFHDAWQAELQVYMEGRV
jgi:hypothetical protein